MTTLALAAGLRLSPFLARAHWKKTLTAIPGEKRDLAPVYGARDPTRT